jgi:hypothetical protein
MISIQKTWYHIWYHTPSLSCTTMKSYKNYDIIYDVTFFCYDIMLNITKTHFSSLSCTNHYWYYPWCHSRNHGKRLWYQDYLISLALIIRFRIWYGVISACDFKITWYHTPMTSPVSLISRHLLGELVRVGGATGQELRLLWIGLTAANELLQVEAPHWQWAWSQSLTRTAQVGHLVMASLSQVHSQSVRSHESGPGQSGVLAGHSVTGSSLSSIMAVVVEIMSLCTSLYES